MVVVLVFVCFSSVHPATLHVEMEFSEEINNDLDVKIAQLMSNLCVVQQIFWFEPQVLVSGALWNSQGTFQKITSRK